MQQVYVLDPVKRNILGTNDKNEQRKSVKFKSSKFLQKMCDRNDMTLPRGLFRTLSITYDEAI